MKYDDFQGSDDVPIEWTMTQAPPHDRRTDSAVPPPSVPASTAPPAPLTRIQRIQQALDEKRAMEKAKSAPPSSPPPGPRPFVQPLSPSSKANKRMNSTPAAVAPDAPPRKRRSLPQTKEEPPAHVPPKPEPNSHTVKKVSSSAKTAALNNSVYTAPQAEDKTRRNGVHKIFLSQEQQQVVDLAARGISLFYTGSAGTGKSVVLREIIRAMRRQNAKHPEAVAITASTGIAACNIGGVTIHSFAGIGLGTEPAEDLAKKIKKNKKALNRWQKTKVLIIDEVSMVDGDLFDKLARIANLLRKPKANSPGTNTQFAGIQLIVTGDFFQLPPVGKGGVTPKFAFESNTWQKGIEKTIKLTQVFRQRDTTFRDMLNEMRFGKVDESSVRKFRSLSRAIQYNDGIGPTELFPRREDVERSNNTRMVQLAGEEMKYQATDGGSLQGEQREKMLNNFMAPKYLFLKKEAQVMCIKNLDETLVNGSMGRILRFVDPSIYGTEDDVEGNGRKPGSSSSKQKEEDKKPKKKADVGKSLPYPVVQFILPHGGTREVLIMPETWKVELPNGEVQASRMQFPLILAWAMSIHKSQGQTLERVKVDLGRIFEKGQAYVALSRATNLDGLQVINFDPRKVEAHPKVIEWTATLEELSSQQQKDEDEEEGCSSEEECEPRYME